MLDKYEEKLNAEIKKIEAETKEIEKKWYKKPNNLFQFLIIIVGATTLGLFSNLYNINNERLKLERAELKRDISDFTYDKDSLFNHILLLSNFSDSLKMNLNNYADSLINVKNNYNHIESKLLKKEERIILLVKELGQIKNKQNSKSLQKQLANLIKIEADAGPDVTICKGQKIVLKASGGKNYLWSTGESTPTITVSPKETTTYSVKVYDEKSSDIDDVTVTIHQNCKAISLGDDITICAGTEVILEATGSGLFKRLEQTKGI